MVIDFYFVDHLLPWQMLAALLQHVQKADNCWHRKIYYVKMTEQIFCSI